VLEDLAFLPLHGRMLYGRASRRIRACCRSPQRTSVNYVARAPWSVSGEAAGIR
jgi:hypothetical protein